MTTVEQRTSRAIRPFHVEFAEEALDDLRRRVAATPWFTRGLVEDRSQGVQLATLEAVSRYWASEYEGRRVESRLNALPLVMTHGWPGSTFRPLRAPQIPEPRR